MTGSILPTALSGLICEGGFTDEEPLLSLCMAMGVFHDVKDEIVDGRRIPDIERLSAYELCALVVDHQSESEVDIEEMKDILARHLLGGMKMMTETVGTKRGIDALNTVASMLPR